MPLQATSGAASYDAFGGGVAAVPNYIEDVFSTWLYTGNGSPLTINNGIDLAGKGGLTWFKDRTTAQSHVLIDSVRGTNKTLFSNETRAEVTQSWSVTYNSNGMTLPGSAVDSSNGVVNFNGYVMASWTFREQPKFFDVVTYTGTGGGPSSVAHNLGAVPGFVLIKSTSRSGNWVTIARQSNGTYALFTDSTNGLQSTAAANNTSANPGAALTATTFDPSWFNNSNTPGAVQNICDNGVTYVAYLFAHNAGGFGLTGTDNVISCGSYTGTSAQGNEQNLGYEPQWVMVKRVSSDGNWVIQDVMRGMPVSSDSEQLYANTSGATFTGDGIYPTATGFGFGAIGSSMNASGSTYIYIAIRRGPMRVPTSGTSVFAPVARTGTGGATTQETGLSGTDLAFTIPRSAAGNNWQWVDRLRGGAAGSAARIQSNNTNQEFSDQSMSVLSSTQTTISYGGSGSNGSGVSYIVECFRRASGFFDVVCYTGTGSATTFNHNLGVAPELMIVKRRNSATYGDWYVYAASQGATKFLLLNLTDAVATNSGPWNNTAPTASVFTAGADLSINSTATYVAYLFASCPGVSKVFNYTGNGSSQTINCGFTGGARFVMIKRTDSTGDWYVWDTARGIVANNDPHLSLNTTAAEVTTNDTIDTDSTGFVVNQVSATNVNVNGASYIGLAIA